MFKVAAIQTISFYQGFISPSLKMILGVNSICRFDETCSAYTKRMISEKGALRGTGLGLKRFLNCQPLSS